MDERSVFKSFLGMGIPECLRSWSETVLGEGEGVRGEKMDLCIAGRGWNKVANTSFVGFGCTHEYRFLFALQIQGAGHGFWGFMCLDIGKQRWLRVYDGTAAAIFASFQASENHSLKAVEISPQYHPTHPHSLAISPSPVLVSPEQRPSSYAQSSDHSHSS